MKNTLQALTSLIDDIYEEKNKLSYNPKRYTAEQLTEASDKRDTLSAVTGALYAAKRLLEQYEE